MAKTYTFRTETYNKPTKPNEKFESDDEELYPVEYLDKLNDCLVKLNPFLEDDFQSEYLKGYFQGDKLLLTIANKLGHIKKDCFVFVLISGFRERKKDKDMRYYLKWLLFRPNAYLKIKNEKNIRMILFDTDHRFLKELLGENASKIDIFNEYLDWIDVSNSFSLDKLDKENINILNLDLSSNTTNTTISNKYGLDDESLGKLKDELKKELKKELKEEIKKELKLSLLLDPISNISSSFLKLYNSVKWN